MTDNQLQAFQAGSGFKVDWIHLMSQLLLGGLTIIIAVALIAQLIHFLGTHQGAEEFTFISHLIMAGMMVVIVLLIMS